MTSTLSLFEQPSADVPLGPGAVLLGAFARPNADALHATVMSLLEAAPLRNMLTPGGRRMSVAMSNCGTWGWVSDARGYRYASEDPLTGVAWPPMPPEFLTLASNAAQAAGYPAFVPDACLINRYAPAARMTLHQDRNETDLAQPIVSVSLGLPAVFQFGGLQRTDPARRFTLQHGDVAVWGGPSRLVFHGVLPLKDGDHPAVGRQRFNLTFRRAR